MTAPLKTVALLVANPALSSILSATLASAPSLRVRPFESQMALQTYLRLAPADLLITDFDSRDARADLLSRELRGDASIVSRRLQIIALASTLTAETQGVSERAGIDEVIIKPMSPRYLLERVLARLTWPRAPQRRQRLHRRDWSAFGDNVIPLFGHAPQI